MTVPRKLALGLAPLVVLIAAQAFLAARAYSRTGHQMRELESDIMPGAIAMADMHLAAMEASHDAMEHMLGGEEHERGAAPAAVARLEKDALAYLEHETHIGADERAAAGRCWRRSGHTVPPSSGSST